MLIKVVNVGSFLAFCVHFVGDLHHKISFVSGS